MSRNTFRMIPFALILAVAGTAAQAATPTSTPVANATPAPVTAPAATAAGKATGTTATSAQGQKHKPCKSSDKDCKAAQKRPN